MSCDQDVSGRNMDSAFGIELLRFYTYVGTMFNVIYNVVGKFSGLSFGETEYG